MFLPLFFTLAWLTMTTQGMDSTLSTETTKSINDIFSEATFSKTVHEWELPLKMKIKNVSLCTGYDQKTSHINFVDTPAADDLNTWAKNSKKFPYHSDCPLKITRVSENNSIYYSVPFTKSQTTCDSCDVRDADQLCSICKIKKTPTYSLAATIYWHEQQSNNSLIITDSQSYTSEKIDSIISAQSYIPKLEESAPCTVYIDIDPTDGSTLQKMYNHIKTKPIIIPEYNRLGLDELQKRLSHLHFLLHDKDSKMRARIKDPFYYKYFLTYALYLKKDANEEKDENIIPCQHEQTSNTMETELLNKIMETELLNKINDPQFVEKFHKEVQDVTSHLKESLTIKEIFKRWCYKIFYKFPISSILFAYRPLAQILGTLNIILKDLEQKLVK